MPIDPNETEAWAALNSQIDHTKIRIENSIMNILPTVNRLQRDLSDHIHNIERIVPDHPISLSELKNLRDIPLFILDRMQDVSQMLRDMRDLNSSDEIR